MDPKKIADILDSLETLFARVRPTVSPRNDPAAPADPKRIEYSAYHRAVIHECGHAVMAWYAWSCHGVSRVVAFEDDGTGVTTASWDPADRSVRQSWDYCAMTMAGIAAELAYFRKLRTGGAGPDLLNAREAAQQIVARHPRPADRGCPWADRLKASNFTVQPYFETTPSPEVVRIMDASFQHALHVLEEHRQQFQGLAKDLIRHRILYATELEQRLGNRSWRRLKDLAGRR
jgi:ATP-dependent Zn protease